MCSRPGGALCVEVEDVDEFRRVIAGQLEAAA
jgi:hypothetical protein